jgi:hypothetical protein
MDWEGKVQTSHFACADCARQLLPGELFFSALIAGGDLGFQRLDYASEHWEGQDHARFISWWRQKVPQPGQERKALKLNVETLGQVFTHLKDSRSRAEQCLAYVVALALVRARKLHFIEVIQENASPLLVIEDRHRRLVHRIRDPGMSDAEQEHVLTHLLDITGNLEPATDPAEGTPLS